MRIVRVTCTVCSIGMQSTELYADADKFAMTVKEKFAEPPYRITFVCGYSRKNAEIPAGRDHSFWIGADELCIVQKHSGGCKEVGG